MITPVKRTPCYRYSTSPENAIYQVTFTQVAAGNYVQRPLGLNGKVYEWVAPVSGAPQGDYEPVIPVALPNSRQLVVAGVTTKISPYETVFAELAASTHDKNLFSELNDHDNQGWAQKAGIRSMGRETGFLEGYRWVSSAYL